MKKFKGPFFVLTGLVFFMLTIPLLSAFNSGQPFDGGLGNPTDPYVISNAYQLDSIRYFKESHFILANDIDLGVEPWSTGNGWKPIGDRNKGPFTGSLDGDGFAIQNLMISTPDSNEVGLFGFSMGARVTDLKLENVHVVGRDYVGSLIGFGSEGRIDQLSVNGTVEGNGSFVGGLVGSLESFSTCIYNSESDVQVSGNAFVGGLAGAAIMENCHSSGVVSGIVIGGEEAYRIGGLAGYGRAMNSSSDAVVSGGTEVGGLLGSGEAYGSHSTGTVTATGQYSGGLIGYLRAFPDQQENAPEYQPGETEPCNQHHIWEQLEADSGELIEIILEDQSIIKFPQIEGESTLYWERICADESVKNSFSATSGLRKSGSMRKFQIAGSGDPSELKPIITIPGSESGTVNPETIFILRSGSVDVDGEYVDEYHTSLAVWINEQGDYQFVDPMFPFSIEPIDTANLNQQEKFRHLLPERRSSRASAQWVGEVKYQLMTYDDHLNWKRRPLLERMIIDTTKAESGYRKVARGASPSEREALRKKPICNVIILVHGHNEEEKLGFVPSEFSYPWMFSYKRRVWDLTYEELVLSNTNPEFTQYPDDCTAIYEFVYPTFRPIFSPVPDKSGWRHATLGEELGRLINEEFETNDQLKIMMDENMPFNLFLVAHSQGGLVARAGLRFVNSEILKNFEGLVTWGSPHLGASLYSLRYALTAGHNAVLGGYSFPMQNIGAGKWYQSKINSMIVDAPGIRDLRWSTDHQTLVKLQNLFVENSSTISDNRDFELPYGKMFFSHNLRLFNENEGLFSGDALRDKYWFYVGITPKRIQTELSWTLAGRVVRWEGLATEIEKGATLNTWVLDSLHRPNDGAVPTYSQRGTGIWPEGNINRRIFDDMDHEEFYGAEPPQRDFSTLLKGSNVVRQTFFDLKLSEETRACPEGKYRVEIEDDTLVVISGELIFPLYNHNDLLVENFIDSIFCYLDSVGGPLVSGFSFEFLSEGKFEGKAKRDSVPPGKLVLLITLKDKSEVIPVEEIDENVHNLTQNKWYATIQEAVLEAVSGDEIVVHPGVYNEAVEVRDKNIKLTSALGPDTTIIDGSHLTSHGVVFIRCNNCEFSGFTVTNWSRRAVYASSSDITIKNNKITDNHNNEALGLRGDVFYVSSSTSVITENLISNNSTYEFYNPGILIWDGEFQISNNVIDNNEGPYEWVRGGGIAIYDEAMGTITNNTIVNNISGYDGGGIYVRANTVSIMNNVLKYNHAENGGGIAIEIWEPESSADFIVSGNTIENNTAYTGGGMFIEANGRVSIENNQVKENEAEGSGGGIYLAVWELDLNNDFKVINNSIVENTALFGDGGGLHIHLNDALVSNNMFIDNSASSGGACYISTGSQTNSPKPTLISNSFLNNWADFRGGGVAGPFHGIPWQVTVSIDGNDTSVPAHVGPWTDANNMYTGNNHGDQFGCWGPGSDNWVEDCGKNIFMNSYYY
ncbi:MAG: hypothetical protein EA409_05900 [Saprospirales bacterium]|nr:MAG: hypothetical protein EA409_05900 [Saprospirales bacterium]